MNYNSHSYMSVKVCEYFPEKYQYTDTIVDLNRLEWASLLAKQEHTQSNNSEFKVDKLSDQYIDDLYNRLKFNRISICSGKTVI